MSATDALPASPDADLPPIPPLPAGYALRAVERFPDPAYRELVEAHLMGEGMIRWDALRDDAGRARAAGPQAAFGALPKQRLGIWHGEALVASTLGWLDGPDRFHMGASVVHPAHRRLGLYTHLATQVLHRAWAEGFSEVWSNHVATNNPILVAKLRLGFMISGFDVSTTHGARVSLVYPLEPVRRAAFLARSGRVRATGPVARYFVDEGG